MIEQAIIPLPRSITTGEGAPLVVTDRLRLAAPGPELVGVAAVVVHLLGRQGIRVAASAEDAPMLSLELHPRVDADTAADDSAAGDESYALSVTRNGISITAPAPAGIFYGAQTLAQVLPVGSTGGEHHLPELHIHDAPRFAYRGVMLDVARHFFDVDTVRAVIDRIALAKINHLHLHLSDDQGWRLHVESWPLLTERGSTGAVGGARGGFYSHDDYREIVAYAAERFVTIVPEIDLPGHTHAAIVAYPDLAPPSYAGAPGTSSPLAPYEGMEVGFSTVDARSELVQRFVADVTRELASLTPGPYLHLGGDESLSTSDDDYDAFLSRASATAAETGKTLVFWHEAGAVANLPHGTVGQYWDFVVPRGHAAEHTHRFAENGGSVILSPSDAAYLDMKHAESDVLGLDWAGGPTSVEASYSWEPLDVIDGLDEDHVLGVEAPLWSETVDSLSGIDALAFPRVLAVAEIAWSPRASENVERTWPSFRRRVAGWQPRLDTLGVGYTRAEGIDWS